MFWLSHSLKDERNYGLGMDALVTAIIERKTRLCHISVSTYYGNAEVLTAQHYTHVQVLKNARNTARTTSKNGSGKGR